MSSDIKQGWEPSDASVKAGDTAYAEHLMGQPTHTWDGKAYDAARRRYAIAAVSADPLLSAAKDMQDALIEARKHVAQDVLDYREELYEVRLAQIDAALRKSRGE